VDIRTKLGKASSVFHRLTANLEVRNNQQGGQITVIFFHRIVPTATYACETRKTTAKATKMIDVFHLRCLGGSWGFHGVITSRTISGVFRIWQRGASRARRAQAYNGSLGAEPPAESRGRAPGRGVREAKLPEAEALFAFKSSMEAANSPIFF